MNKEIFSAAELSSVFEQKIDFGICDIKISSKEVREGDLFVAIRGSVFDGHDFCEEALKNGASLLLVEKKIANLPENRQILVDSYMTAMEKLAKFNVARTNAKIIGVTGSVGKTTTKEMLQFVLSRQSSLADSVYASQKNFNSQIGMPVCAAKMPQNSSVSVLEMGMSQAGEIKRLVDIAPPIASIITSICETHLEFFGTMFDIAKAKSEIFETENPQEFALIPQDCAYTDFLREKARNCGVKKVFSFGFAENADVRVISYEFLEQGFNVVADFAGEKITYQLNCHNISTISNSISAIFAAHLISGIPLEQLAQSMENFSAIHGRGEIFYLNNRDIVLIDDSYNACLTSVRSAIQSMLRYKDRRKVLIFGDMGELGPNSVNFHRQLSPAVDKFGVDVVYACGELAKKFFDNLRDAKKGEWFENSAQLSEVISDRVQDGDCILVKGSRFMKMERVVEALKESDSQVKIYKNGTDCR